MTKNSRRDPGRSVTGGGADHDPGFLELFAQVDEIPGWLTPSQAARLYTEVQALPTGSNVVEIGSHQGRSTVVLAGAREDVAVTAIDPFVGGKFGGELSRRHFEHNLRTHGVADRVRLVAQPAAEVRSGWAAPVALVYVDGKHDCWSTAEDLRWSRFLPPGGRVLVHDAFSSLGVTLAILFSVLPRGELRYLGRVGSLATFERARPRVRDRVRIIAELPWWLRNLGIKVLLRLRLRALARVVGHHDTFDPY
jgi:predicted O-methyltransferase YrrM